LQPLPLPAGRPAGRTKTAALALAAFESNYLLGLARGRRPTFEVTEHIAHNMVPHIPFPKDVSYPEGYIRFRCPNLSCAVVHVTGALDGFYVLDPSGKLKPFS
jgi:hypothetical protein